jgi:Zn-dependent protease/CBS domain-containing protein
MQRATTPSQPPPQRGLDLGRIAGIEIAIDYSWLVVFTLVLWSLAAGYFPSRHPGYGWGSYLAVGLVATLLFFGSVLVHELAHALVGNRLGEDVRRITLFIFGGMAHLSREPRSPGAEIAIAAVGPLTSFALAALFWAVGRLLETQAAPPLWTAILQYLAFVNAALAVFNLLPGFPLDGGRLLRAFFWHRSGDLRAATARAAAWGGHVATGLMMVGALQIFGGALVGGLWSIFIAMFLRSAAHAGVQAVMVEQVLGRTAVASIMVENPVTVPPDLPVAEAVERYFLRYGFGGFPVVRDGRVEGLLSLRDVRACPAEERARRTVREIMRPAGDDIAIAPTASVADAIRRMAAAGSGRLLVLEGDRLRALITREGVTRFVQTKAALEPPA